MADVRTGNTKADQYQTAEKAIFSFHNKNIFRLINKQQKGTETRAGSGSENEAMLIKKSVVKLVMQKSTTKGNFFTGLYKRKQKVYEWMALVDVPEFIA